MRACACACWRDPQGVAESESRRACDAAEAAYREAFNASVSADEKELLAEHTVRELSLHALFSLAGRLYKRVGAQLLPKMPEPSPSGAPCPSCSLQRCVDLARAVFADIAVGEESIRKAHEAK